eukprot:1207555-Rhodomonas_salina.2
MLREYRVTHSMLVERYRDGLFAYRAAHSTCVGWYRERSFSLSTVITTSHLVAPYLISVPRIAWHARSSMPYLRPAHKTPACVAATLIRTAHRTARVCSSIRYLSTAHRHLLQCSGIQCRSTGHRIGGA